MFNFNKKKIPSVEASLPPGLRVYCIGDIHGRNDLLNGLLSKIMADQVGYQGQLQVVYVGDYIDRGMNSKEVVELLANQHCFSNESIFIRGNHEQALLHFLDDDSVGPAWLSFGGLATLASYGVAMAKMPTKRQDYIDLQQRLKEHLPEHHEQFLRKTIFSYQVGSYFFVHAGINPKYSITRQNVDDLMWIRDEFVSSKKNFEKIIVHGHTVSEKPEFRSNRIGIDTGAYASGVLTCLVLEGQEQRLLQTND